jgi:hypothetical protein
MCNVGVIHNEYKIKFTLLLLVWTSNTKCHQNINSAFGDAKWKKSPNIHPFYTLFFGKNESVM